MAFWTVADPRQAGDQSNKAGQRWTKQHRCRLRCDHCQAQGTAVEAYDKRPKAQAHESQEPGFLELCLSAY